MKIINLTTHNITVGDVEIPASGTIARCETVAESIDLPDCPVPDGATVLGEEYEPCRNFSSDKWRKIALDRGLL